MLRASNLIKVIVIVLPSAPPLSTSFNKYKEISARVFLHNNVKKKLTEEHETVRNIIHELMCGQRHVFVVLAGITE